jgi:hypothetical protein
MFKKATIILGLLILLLGQAACDRIGVDTEATATAIVAETQAAAALAEQTQQAQATADARATISALETAAAQATLDAQATADAQATEAAATAAAQATADASATAVANRNATSTAIVERRATSTAVAMASATAQAQPMAGVVNQLFADGYITRTDGDYYQLDDFDEAWAQLGWYAWWPASYDDDLADFVVHTHAAWTSASDKANPDDSGCGFVFRAIDQDNYYVTFLGLDGNVSLIRQSHDYNSLVGIAYYGQVGFPDGEADITLAADGDWITILVNGDEVLRRQDQANAAGTLHYTLFSGTNKDYGTHCMLTDVGLWILK